MKTKNEIKRLTSLSYNGFEILYADLSHMEREEGAQVLADLVAQLKARPDNSVRLLMNTSNAKHDPRQANEWKALQPFFSTKVLKVGIFGLSALLRIVYAGYRMSANVMGQDNPDKLGKAFSSQEEAMDYLAS